MASPRRITAAEILAERATLRTELGAVHHGTGRGWSSLLWVSCDCPNCRDKYDPTGEESAKYLNMDASSFFRGQVEMPSFGLSKIAKESLLYAAKPGFYLDWDSRMLDLPTLLERLTPPLAVRPRTILRICEDGTWDELVLSTDGANWTRRTYRNGRSVYYPEDENPAVPNDVEQLALRQRLCQF